MAGTPSLLDISRLIQKIKVRSFQVKDLPDELAKKINKNTEVAYLFGVKWSGVAVLDELHLARVLLYSKIYRHSKVVAIEQMIKSVVEQLHTAFKIDSLLKLFYGLEDDALLCSTSSIISSYLSSEGVVPCIVRAEELFECIRLRNIYPKAFQLQERYPGDPLEHDPVQKQGLVEFAEDLAQPDKRLLLVREILEKVQEFLGSPSGRAVAPPWTVAELSSRVLFNIQSKQSGGAQIGRAYLMPTSGRPVPFRDYTVNRHGWADSYLSDQPQGYVFADSRIADFVFVAIEWIMRMKYDVQFCPSVVETAKRNQNDIDEIKANLLAEGFYEKAPFDLRPEPATLKSAYASNVVSRFEAKLNAYQAPEVGLAVKGGTILPEARIRTWLRQFETDEYIECAAKMLDAFRLIERRDTVAAIRAFVVAHPQFRGATIVPFGAAKDSGVIQAYFAADLLGAEVGRCCSLEQAVEAKALNIVFIDDFVASGGQASDILAAGFGIDALRKPLGEQRELFEDKSREYLLQNKVAFLFTAAWDDGIAAVNEIAADIGLDATVFRHLGEADIPFAFEDNTFDGIDKELVAEFKKFCRSTGENILKSEMQGSTGYDQQKLASRKLGYGNRGMLLASPFNVPTQTLTLCWQEGYVGDILWRPLFARRKKK